MYRPIGEDVMGNPVFVTNAITSATDIMKLAAEQSEKVVLAQLNDFISRGLIVLESTGPLLTRSSDSDKIEMRYACNLVLKDKEYILKLEKENKEMKELLEKLKAVGF